MRERKKHNFNLKMLPETTGIIGQVPGPGRDAVEKTSDTAPMWNRRDLRDTVASAENHHLG
jgi:hypothetical protein